MSSRTLPSLCRRRSRSVLIRVTDQLRCKATQQVYSLALRVDATPAFQPHSKVPVLGPVASSSRLPSPHDPTRAALYVSQSTLRPSLVLSNLLPSTNLARRIQNEVLHDTRGYLLPRCVRLRGTCFPRCAQSGRPRTGPGILDDSQQHAQPPIGRFPGSSIL